MNDAQVETVFEYIPTICQVLGIDPKNTAEIVIRPYEIQAALYERDKDGKLVIEDITHSVSEAKMRLIRWPRWEREQEGFDPDESVDPDV